MLFSGKLAILRYDTPQFSIVQRGDHVLCAVTGERIPLNELRYWSVDHQEAYRGPAEAHAAYAAGGAARLSRRG
ncbi:DUF2093 domain-containing protein [Rhizorhabdus wittichii]|jgi:hypothetical protein|uniref:DUF2093 domain-containing protein n=2 Tax=Rhizorhabdus wittichii TaxID=160791 RepID=A0A9J9LEH6_RHIWR|nr:DUF2093 domain-containing protein [Rhizorhabdus wittichii]ABQ70742.1 Uncharacterized protein Swit_4404 [Rhizorhabdus wittichii RW1]ARR52511.1 hypothetical protein HY78_03110 [Rhizorhabdus wittichii DC-6]QTH23754.1 DUF2093 domain-containing protein [Rhizorhabdus wittichii]